MADLKGAPEMLSPPNDLIDRYRMFDEDYQQHLLPITQRLLVIQYLLDQK